MYLFTKYKNMSLTIFTLIATSLCAPTIYEVAKLGKDGKWKIEQTDVEPKYLNL
jgi:hypothetical protein